MFPALALVLGLAQVAPLHGEARTCEIRGRVTDRETGQPLARVFVRLRTADGEEQLSTRTDDTGRFRFAGLMPGQYSGEVEGGPFRSTHSSEGLYDGPGRPIVLKRGEVREINVALTRTFAISVRVVDQRGDPLSGITVAAYAPGHEAAIPPMWRSHTTDDHGRQRVFGLLPGTYIVCAASDVAGVSHTARREAFLRTCYPSAADDSEAEPVRVDGSDVGEIEIRMRTGRTFVISGRVVDASGAPAQQAHVMLSKYGPGGSSSSGIQIVESDGQLRIRGLLPGDSELFRIPGVLPGEYAIGASIGGPDRPEHRRPLERAFVPIRVEGADVSNVLVALQKTVDVAGRIIAEDPTARFGRTPGYAPMVVLSRLVEDVGAGAGSATFDGVGDDRRFTIRDVFGRRTLELANVPHGWYVKSIRYAGTEIIDEFITFTESAEPAIEIILSNRGAVVTGRVTDDCGVGVQGATVLMFTTDRERMPWRLPYPTRASRTGEFRAGPVRGGEYFLVALPADVRPIQLGESERLQRLATVAERVTLGDLDERTIDLRLLASDAPARAGKLPSCAVH